MSVSDTRLNRREVLQVLGWWIAVSATPLPSRAEEENPAASVGLGPAAEESTRILAHTRSAVRIGHAYLKAYPDESDLDRLRGALGLPGEGALRADAVTAHRRRLREVHRQDFREGRVRELAGFTMSLTELRLSAIVALGTMKID